MGKTSYYMHVSVRGAINNLQKSRAKKSCFQDDDGHPLTRLQAIDSLMDELSKGHEVIPAHHGCRNPCKNNPKCKGFDYGEKGGCPGYEIEEAPHDPL